MDLRINRYHSTSPSIDGQLSINGLTVCDTAENQESALPLGTYPLHFSRCGQYGRKMLIVNEQPDCTQCLKHRIGSQLGTLPVVCPMLKAGNGVHHRADGTIIVGARIQSGILIHSGKYFDRIYERVKKAAKRAEPITLTITSEPIKGFPFGE